MRRFGALPLTLLLLLGLPGPAPGQSMGEAAKKERERREKLRQQAGGGAAPTVDADSLASNKGALANDAKQPGAAAGSPGGTSRAQKTSEPAQPEQAGGGKDELYWRGRVAAYRRRVEEAQQRRDAIDRMIRFGQGGQYDESGVRRIYSQQAMKQFADAADAQLAAAQAALEALADEGRRAGALPGWFR